MRIVAGAVLIISLGGATCVPEVPPPSQATLDRVSICSGGLGVTLDQALAAEVAQNVEIGGQVSVSLRRRLEGAIFQGLTASERQLVFPQYLACIRGQDEIDAMIAEVEAKWAGIRALVGDPRYPPLRAFGVMTRLEALHRDEIAALREYRLIDAREFRKAIIIELAFIDRVLAQGHGESPLQRPTADGVSEPRPPRPGPPICRLYAPDEC